MSESNLSKIKGLTKAESYLRDVMSRYRTKVSEYWRNRKTLYYNQ